MIPEELLADLLAERAGRIPVPAAGVDTLLTHSPEVERRALTRRVTRPSARVLVGAIAVCLVTGIAVAIAWPNHASTPTFHNAAAPSPALVPPTTIGSSIHGPVRNDAPIGQGAAGGASALAQQGAFSAAQPSSVAKGAATDSNAVTAPTDTARVVRTASLDLRIARHSFGTVVSRGTTVAAAEGGFIANANTNEAAATPSGTMTVRVPSARFNDTIGRLRALGTVESQTTRGVDVTGQYTDLHARLNAATATRDAYLSILSRASNIGDVLAVQDRIESVQTQIDQLQGQINQLDDQTTYATITLSASEPPPKAKAIELPHRKSGLEVAWDNARDGFSRRVEGLISHSGSALVILLMLAALAFLLRMLLPRARRLLV